MERSWGLGRCWVERKLGVREVLGGEELGVREVDTHMERSWGLGRCWVERSWGLG